MELIEPTIIKGWRKTPSLPYPAAWRGGTKQNIGETVRSNGEAETTIEQRCLTPPLCFATQNIGEVAEGRRG